MYWVGNMNIDNIETEEEKEAFDKMSKPKTKVEYVKVDFEKSIFDLAHELKQSSLFNADESEIENETQLCEAFLVSEVYRKVETPVEWWEGAAEYVMGINKDSGELSYSTDGKSMKIFKDLTKEQWKEFAKLILEE